MVTHQLKHATRFQTHEPRALAASFDDSSGNCLRLHEVGFALPRVSPLERCALTAPFHPYRAKYRSAQRGGLFSVALSLTLQRVGGGYPPPCPTVLGLSSRTVSRRATVPVRRRCYREGVQKQFDQHKGLEETAFFAIVPDPQLPLLVSIGAIGRLS